MANTSITHRLSEMGFRVYSEDEIRKLSVKEIKSPQQFDNMQLPTIGGLYDPALGSTNSSEECGSCGQSGLHCPGHSGHIELPFPVFNPVFFGILVKILKSTCLQCHRLFLKEEDAISFIYQMKLVEKGCVVDAKKLQEYVLVYTAEKQEHFRLYTEELVANLENMVKKTIKDASASVTHCTKVTRAEMARLLDETMVLLANPPRRKCPHCHTSKFHIKSEYNRITASKSSTVGGTPKATNKRKSGPTSTQPKLNGEVVKEEDDNEIEHLMKDGKGHCLIMPHLAKKIVRKILQNDGKILRKLFRCMEEFADEKAADVFFITVLPVPPSRFRPLSVMGDRKFENPQTGNLSQILSDCCEIRRLLTQLEIDQNKSEELLKDEEDGNKTTDSLRALWTQLQNHVNSLIDSDLDRLTPDASKTEGVRQLLEKKEGLFRMHMMGKRVNYAARSIIAPDVSISTNEIGVPAVFAKKLTYPQPVTPWNVHELRQSVINGPNTYPGASAVINEDGSVVKLSPHSHIMREAAAKQLLTPSNASERNQLPKQVLRHLKDGDVLLLNRQPTLHRPSIQAHKARVLPMLKTFRLHYSNCKAYNADFDGDEMNAHFPQSELGRAESYGIACTDHQYLVPKDGAPLAGLIQDHVVSGVTLTVRGQFFTKEVYCNLVQTALANKRERLKLLPPAIMKPRALWSGKQVISTLLLNIIPKNKAPLSMKGKCKISEKGWIKAKVQDPWRQKISMEKLQELGESTMLVSHGELLQGVLDKSQCGPSSFGLVHYVFELYGGETAGQLLTCLGWLLTACLRQRGFTLGVEDILVQERAERKRAKIIRKSSKKGRTAVLEAFGQVQENCSDAQLQELMKKAHFSEDEYSMQKLDMVAKNATFAVQDGITVSTTGKGLYKNFPDNNLQLIVQSGAKGSSVNCMQISSLVGQIELEGRRPPLMESGRSLPCYLPYDLSLKSRGFVTDRFATGISPQGCHFHCMAGREGLVDTAVKTSRSGYLQRCLIKHLESLTVNYDHTVRDNDGSVIQFLYGNDGLEVTKTSLLEETQLPFLLKNQQVIGSHVEHATESKQVKKYKKKISKWEKKHKGKQERGSGFLDFCKARQQNGMVNHDTTLDEATGRSTVSKVLEIEWRGLDSKQKHKFMKKHKRCPDPVLSNFWPQLNFGVVSEKIQTMVGNLQQKLLEVGRGSQDESKQAQSVADSTTLYKVVNNRVMRSLCEPGEAVGILCAQSLGEQTTQMTLNTFHLAGRGEMNVTLGIPRLREVLMHASSSIMTPCVDVPVLDTPEAAAAAKKLQMKMSHVPLSDVLEDVQISDYLDPSPCGPGRKCRMYRVRFTILPRHMYSDKLDMKPKEIIKWMEKRFLGRLGTEIKKGIGKLTKKPRQFASLITMRDNERQGREADTDEAIPADDPRPPDDGDLDEDVHDEDASTVKELQRHTDEHEYEGDEEESQEVENSPLSSETEGLGDTSPKTEGEEGEEEEQDKDEEDMDIEKLKSCVGVHEYSRDRKGKWCEIVYKFKAEQFLVVVKPIVEREAWKCMVQSVPGIKRCMLIERSDDDRFKGQKRLYFVTEGTNLMEMMNYWDILDLNKLYTNNIVDIQNTYGIDAANSAIIKEVQKVFKAYNIVVNYRHLSLLADYMTCEGQYQGCNRISMGTNPSPLQNITFETATSFLIKACITNWPDKLQSPSSQIVTGRVVSAGTGSFDILQPLQTSKNL